MCPSPSRHISGKKHHLSSISHIDTSMTYCPLKIRKITGFNISRWSSNQRQHREQHFCALLGYVPIYQDSQLCTYSMYNKRYDINFLITNVPFLSSNILSSPVYGVLSHSSYVTPVIALLILRAVRLSNRHLGQGYFKGHLKSSLWKCYGRYGDIIKLY